MSSQTSILTKLISIGILVWILSTPAIAQENWIFVKYYSDGSVEEYTIDERSFEGAIDFNVFTIAKDNLTATLDAYISIDNDNEEIRKVSPGQTVYLNIFFNSLDSVGVPFEQLVGKQIFFLQKLIGGLSYKDIDNWGIIEEGDEGWCGVGMSYTVPEGTEEGMFIYIGGMKIEHITCVENRDRERYRVLP